MHGQSEIEKVFGEKPEWDCPHCEFKAHIKNEVKRHIAAEHGEKELKAYKLRDIKGQLISKCLLGVIVSTKKPTNFLRISALASKERLNQKLYSNKYVR